MNKIYKIIWSHVTSGWVVVSEGAKQRGKTASIKEAPQLSSEFHHAVWVGKLGIVPLLLLSAFSPSVFAQQVPAVLSGLVQTATFDKNTYVSTYQLLSNNDNQLSGGTPEGILLSGFGNGTPVLNYFYGYTDSNGLTNIIIGDSTGDTNNASLFRVNAGRIQMGNGASAGANSSIALGVNASAAGNNGIALGVNASAAGNNSMALGGNATAAGNNGIAIGQSASAGPRGDNTAIGLGSVAAASNGAINGATALGAGASATGANSIAIGMRAGFATIASGDGAIAMGNSASATAITSIALGRQAVSNQNGAIAMGQSASATGSGSLALGGATGGFGSAGGAAASGTNAVALGNGSVANVANSVALGSSSVTASALSPTTGGNTAVTSTTIGGQLFANYAAGTPAGGLVSVGQPNLERRIQNVAAGLVSPNSTDAINGSQLYAVASATTSNIASLSTSTSTGINSLSTGLSSTNSSVASLSTSTSTGLSSATSSISSLST
ncbi:ESPR-type extended signal peptide-containing protein, partial [Burkholderia territorii]|uniref:ESPR-type extended signal peptide-containing protein n=1 Tax=Burkholderia territorii TaxID=1503055 RepID=UPI000A697A5A